MTYDWEKIKHKKQDKHTRYDWYTGILMNWHWTFVQGLCGIQRNICVSFFFVSLLVSERTQNTVMLFWIHWVGVYTKFTTWQLNTQFTTWKLNTKVTTWQLNTKVTKWQLNTKVTTWQLNTKVTTWQLSCHDVTFVNFVTPRKFKIYIMTTHLLKMKWLNKIKELLKGVMIREK